MQTVIFDMDGVLVDSEYTFFKSKSDMLAEAGHPVETSYHYQFMGTTFTFMWEEMKKEFDLPKSVDEYIQEMNQRRKAIFQETGVKPIKGAVALVKALHQAGFKLAVASASPRNEIKQYLTELGIIDCFSAYVSADEVEHGKPAPDVFLEAAKRIARNSSECIVFEDTKNGSRAAKNAGMYTIGFANPEYPKQDLSAADKIVTDYQQGDIQRLLAM